MPRGRKAGSKNKKSVEQGFVEPEIKMTDMAHPTAAIKTAPMTEISAQGDVTAKLLELAMSVNKTVEKYDQNLGVLINFQNQVNTILATFDQRIKALEGAQRTTAPVFTETIPAIIVAKDPVPNVVSKDNSSINQVAPAPSSPSQPGPSMNGRVNEAADLGLD